VSTGISLFKMLTCIFQEISVPSTTIAKTTQGEVASSCRKPMIIMPSLDLFKLVYGPATLGVCAIASSMFTLLK
jgi:hypothetical protein